MSPGLLAEWAEWMAAAGMSPRTITDRVQLVSRFERITGCASVSADWRDLAAFLADERYSAGTRQTYHANLRAWFHWLLLMDKRRDDPTARLRSPKAPRRRPRPVSIEQLGRILEVRMHHRTRVMVLLASYEGFRVSEIAQVRGEHLVGGDIRVIGKGGVDSDLPLHPLVAAAAERMPARGWWFPGSDRGHICAKSVSTIIGKAMRRAGVPGTPHCLRHFFGTHTLRSSGGNLRTTQELLRHANVSTTAIYTEVDDDQRRSAVLALPVPLRPVA